MIMIELNFVKPTEHFPMNPSDKCNITCLVIRKNTFMILTWNQHELCWDDEDADDYAFDAMDIVAWAYLPNASHIPDLNKKS